MSNFERIVLPIIIVLQLILLFLRLYTISSKNWEKFFGDGKDEL
jgi:hypothetical protein